MAARYNATLISPAFGFGLSELGANAETKATGQAAGYRKTLASRSWPPSSSGKPTAKHRSGNNTPQIIDSGKRFMSLNARAA